MNSTPATATAATPIAILGVPFDPVTTGEAIARIERMIASRRPHHLVTANVDFLVQAMHDVELRRILVEADLVLCDGMPLVWLSRLLGNPLPERVAGSDLAPLLIRVAAMKGYRIFFLGGEAEAAERAAQRIRSQYPGVIVSGSYSPPFRDLLEMDHDEIKRRIEAARPDLLLVAFGCPKQEKWIAMHHRALGVPVAIGVGATIDFLSGRTPRAPQWMRQAGLEWIFRLAQEPRRLLRRYAIDLWRFGRAIVPQVWRMGTTGHRTLQHIAAHTAPRTAPPFSGSKNPPIPDASLDVATPATSIPCGGDQNWRIVRIPERLDMETLHRTAFMCEQALSVSRACLLDLSRVRFIDSSGIGLLIRLQKKARIASCKLILLSPGEAPRSCLRLMRLEDYFAIAPDWAAARRLLSPEPPRPPVIGRHNYFPSRPSIQWQGEITVANAKQVWKTTSGLMIQQAGNTGKILIDLSRLDFIDSTGVSLMLRARRLAKRLGLRLAFVAPTPNVRNVLRVSKLDSTLLNGTK